LLRPATVYNELVDNNFLLVYRKKKVSPPQQRSDNQGDDQLWPIHPISHCASAPRNYSLNWYRLIRRRHGLRVQAAQALRAGLTSETAGPHGR
jgi:hypothetical protein